MERHRPGHAIPSRVQARRSTKLLLIAIVGTILTMLTLQPAGAAESTPDQFTLSADFIGLYPAADLDVPVTVHNPGPTALLIRTANVIVGDATPFCGSNYVTAASYVGQTRLAAGGTAVIPIRMQMSGSAPDACQGVTFPLTFDATGEVLAAGAPGTSDRLFALTGSNAASLAILGAVAVMLRGTLIAVRRSRPAEIQ